MRQWADTPEAQVTNDTCPLRCSVIQILCSPHYSNVFAVLYWPAGTRRVELHLTPLFRKQRGVSSKIDSGGGEGGEAGGWRIDIPLDTKCPDDKATLIVCLVSA